MQVISAPKLLDWHIQTKKYVWFLLAPLHLFGFIFISLPFSLPQFLLAKQNCKIPLYLSSPYWCQGRMETDLTFGFSFRTTWLPQYMNPLCCTCKPKPFTMLPSNGTCHPCNKYNNKIMTSRVKWRNLKSKAKQPKISNTKGRHSTYNMGLWPET